MYSNTINAARRALGEGSIGTAQETVDNERLVDLVRLWFGLSETQRRAFSALIGEVGLVSDLVETSVDELSTRFQSMADSARGQHARLSQIIDETGSVDLGGRSVTMSELIEFVHQRLSSILDHVMESSRQEQLVLDALNDILADISGIESLLSSISTVNTRTTFLALNARIEAARSGESGKGFVVIAQEMRALSQSINEIAGKVRENIQRVANGVLNGHEIIERIASVDMSDNVAAKEDIAHSMWQLADKNDRLNDAVRESAASVDQISSDVFSAITAMQFQDRTKQRLENVSATLAALQDVISGMQAQSQQRVSVDPADIEPAEEWIKELISDRTLGEVRERFVKHILLSEVDSAGDDSKTSEQDEPDNDVELF